MIDKGRGDGSVYEVKTREDLYGRCYKTINLDGELIIFIYELNNLSYEISSLFRGESGQIVNRPSKLVPASNDEIIEYLRKSGIAE
jgi:hypothetical protein